MMGYIAADEDALSGMNKTELKEEYLQLLDHHNEETASLIKRMPKKGPSVLVIGPDGVGKTTIVTEMSKRTGLPTFKCPSEKQLFKDGGKDSLPFDYMLTHFLKQTGTCFISDRAYPCEFVYSVVFDRETNMDLLLHIDEAHAALGTQILYLYSSVQPVEPDDIVPSDKYFPLKEMYDFFCDSWTDCKVVKYDTAQSLHLSGQERADYDTLACMKLLGLL